MENTKQRNIRYVSIGVGAIAALTLGTMTYLQSQINKDLRRERNQIVIAEKVVYTPKMTPEKAGSYQSVIEHQFNRYLKDDLPKSYKGKKDGESVLRNIFYGVAKDHPHDKENDPEHKSSEEKHKIMVDLYKDYTYKINSISGLYKDNGNASLLIGLTVKDGNNLLYDNHYYVIDLDSKGRVVGGAIYGKYE